LGIFCLKLVLVAKETCNTTLVYSLFCTRYSVFCIV